MDIQQINRADPESIRVSVKNIDGGGSLTVGYGVRLVTTAASFDGVGVVAATAADIKNFYGVMAKDVAINGYGKAIVYGYAASCVISNVGTSITVTAGDILKVGGVSGTWFSAVTDAAMTTVLNKYIIVGSTNTVSALAYVQGFVHGM
jgi:hypothetical protein